MGSQVCIPERGDPEEGTKVLVPSMHALHSAGNHMHSTCQGGFLNSIFFFLFFSFTRANLLFSQLQKIDASFQLKVLA